MAKRDGARTIEMPRRVVASMVEAYRKWEEFRDEREGFVLSADREFIKKMRKARKEDLGGKVRSLEELKREL